MMKFVCKALSVPFFLFGGVNFLYILFAGILGVSGTLIDIGGSTPLGEIGAILALVVGWVFPVIAGIVPIYVWVTQGDAWLFLIVYVYPWISILFLAIGQTLYEKGNK